MKTMHRREFVQRASTLALGISAAPAMALSAAEKPTPSASHLPRWRGFNLTEKCVKRNGGNAPFREGDFALLAEWGFDFTRLPLSYQCWADPADSSKLRADGEGELKHLDDAVQYGTKHGVHVNLNLHRAPGYCVNRPKEPLDLWKDEAALDACALPWRMRARRVKC